MQETASGVLTSLVKKVFAYTKFLAKKSSFMQNEVKIDRDVKRPVYPEFPIYLKVAVAATELS